MMSEKLTQLFRGLLAQNLNSPNYGVSAAFRAGEPSRIDLVLTFKRGSRYCCSEAGCHIGFFKPSSWTMLRKQLVEVGIEEPPYPITLQVNGIVEEGALLTCLRCLGISEASPACEYVTEFHEQMPPSNSGVGTAPQNDAPPAVEPT